MFALAGLVGALVAVPIAVYASHQFTDVPNTNPFHADIDWLADAGVTKGCGGSSYCPKDNVTREQMAAFMRRLSEGQVVDAGSLAGYPVGNLIRADENSSQNLPDGNVDVLSATLHLPTAGIVVAGGKLRIDPNGSETVFCELTAHSTAGSIDLGNPTTLEIPGPLPETCQVTGATVLPAGDYSITLSILGLGLGSLNRDGDVWAIFIPFDFAGNQQ
jgi:hypothetical protein